MAEYCECCEALGFDPHAGLEGGYCRGCGHWHGGPWPRPLTPSADVPACRDEDPAHQAVLAAAYPDPPEYAHPEDDPFAAIPEAQDRAWREMVALGQELQGDDDE